MTARTAALLILGMAIVALFANVDPLAGFLAALAGFLYATGPSADQRAARERSREPRTWKPPVRQAHR